MIAVDAMGGDHAPREIVLGALQAARKEIPLGLYGDEEQLESLLTEFDPHWHTLPIIIFHCGETIDMGEEPSRGVLKKKDSSLVRAAHAVAKGEATALISAGNSGASLVAGSLILGRADGVLRPAIGDFLPTQKGSIFCIDLGANTDCKPEYLEQFALMGQVYVQLAKQIESPRIALLSNGEEAYKGSQMVKEVYKRLEKSDLNFVGNLEPRDMFDDRADVLVCDGFMGNILLKSVQGTAKAISAWLKQEGTATWWKKALFALNVPVFNKLKEKMDYTKKGGALLLGIKHPLIIAHGSSNATAMEHAILFAHHLVQENFIPIFNEQLTALIKKRSVSFTVSQRLRAMFNLRQK